MGWPLRKRADGESNDSNRYDGLDSLGQTVNVNVTAKSDSFGMGSERAVLRVEASLTWNWKQFALALIERNRAPNEVEWMEGIAIDVDRYSGYWTY